MSSSPGGAILDEPFHLQRVKVSFYIDSAVTEGALSEPPVYGVTVISSDAVLFASLESASVPITSVDVVMTPALVGRYLAMNPGYDEALREVSPGHLLTENLVQDCIERGVKELDLLGDDAPYKREWTQEVRQHHWLFIYRDTLVGKTLQRSKFRWAPVAKRMVGRWVRRR